MKSNPMVGQLAVEVIQPGLIPPWLLDMTSVEGHPVWTLPVFARGKLFVRFEDRLGFYAVKSNR